MRQARDKRGDSVGGGRGPRPMGLRGSKDDSGRQTVSFRLPPELRDYIQHMATEEGRDKTEVICGALELDRDVQDKLQAESARLRAYAEDQGLKMSRDLAEVLARLVRRGLDSHESERRASRTK